MSPHLLIFLILFQHLLSTMPPQHLLSTMPPQHLLSTMPIWTPRLFIIFVLTSTEIDDLSTNVPISKFQQLNMSKAWEKHVKKDPYVGIIVH